MRYGLTGSALLLTVAGAVYLSCQPDSGSTPAGTAPTPSPGGGSTPAGSSASGSGEGAPAAQAGVVAIEAFDAILPLSAPVGVFPANADSQAAIDARRFDSVAIDVALTASASGGVSLGRKAADIDQAFRAAPSGSRAYCETVNSAMKFFKQVSEPDLQLCALKSMARGVKAIPSGRSVIWDAKVNMGGMAMAYRFKFKVESSAGKVTGFESYTCQGEDGALKQVGYVRQTSTSESVEVLTRISEPSRGDFKLRVAMTAPVDLNGKLVGLKELDYAEAMASDSGGLRKVHGKVSQSAGNIRYIGYEDVGRLTQYYSFAELLDDNAGPGLYAVTKLAYGSGAALVKVTEAPAAPILHREGWSGETLGKKAEEPRLGKVKDQESALLASAGDVLDLEFAAAEKYDCTGAAEETVSLTPADMDGCFAAYDIDQAGNGLCSSLTF